MASRLSPKEQRLLARLKLHLPDRLDYLWVHEWFDKGGAELETLHLIESTLALKPGIKIGLISTTQKHFRWMKKLPKSVHILRFGKQSKDIPPSRRKIILFQLLKETRPAVIHNVISRLCWEVFSQYGNQLVKAGIKLVATSFCIDYDRRGKEVCLAGEYSANCRHLLSCMLTDNQKHANELSKKFKFPRSLVVVTPMPAPTLANTPVQKEKKALFPKLRDQKKRYRVLWAGRLDRQKKPEILYLIAHFQPDWQFDIFGDVVAETGDRFFYTRRLRKAPNIHLCGSFDSPQEIPVHRYDAFLYTSGWDGLPNILLEMGCRGIPIVAPDVGGIHELITHKTGFLVSGPAAVDEYLVALDYIRKRPHSAQRRAQALMRKIKKTRSQKHLQATWGPVLRNLELLPYEKN